MSSSQPKRWPAASTPESKRTPSDSARAIVGICAGLTVAIWAVFFQTCRFDFINFDDDKYIYEDPNVLQPLSLGRLLNIFVAPDSALWHPLTTLSHILDYRLFGLAPGPHHLVNVAFHNIAAVLLFIALRQLTGSLWRSGFVAAVFAIHPMRVESVAWVTERKDVLSGIFLALTLLAYNRYGRAPSLTRYLAVAACVAGGLLSKPTFLTFPIVLLLIDYWPLDRARNISNWAKLIAEKIPLVVLSGVAFFETVKAQSVTLPSLEQLAILPRVKNAIVSIMIYLRQMIWPTKLAIFYPHPHDQLSTATVLLSAGAIAVLTLLVIFRGRQQPYLAVGWFWFLGLLVPVLGFVQAGLQGHADRFTYLAHIGVVLAITWGVVDLTSRWQWRSPVLASAAAACILTMGAISWKQTTYWRNSVTVWQRDLAVTDESYTGHQNLAAALWKQGDQEESRTHTLRAQVVRWAVAVRDYPEDVKLRDNLGVALVQSGDVAGAIREWQQSAQIASGDGNALNNLAWVLATNPDPSVRDGRRAVEYAQRAMQLPGGNQALLLRTLAAAQAEAGDFVSAITSAQQAIELANARGNSSLAQTLGHELSLYSAGQPYRESPANE